MSEVGLLINYMVMDDLAVKPLSTFSISSLLKQFQVMEIGALEEKVVHLGKDEVGQTFFFFFFFLFWFFNFLFLPFDEHYEISKLVKLRILFLATRILILKHDIINCLFR